MVSAEDDLSDQPQGDASIDSIDSGILGDAGTLDNIISQGEPDDFDDMENDIDSTDDGNSDSNSEIPVDEKTFDAIQYAIAGAKENDTIILNGTYTANEKNMIIVNRAVTIQGVDNAVLDGNGFKVRFRIDCPNVIFKGIRFKNFKLEDNETALIITKKGVTVSDCSFINNTGEMTAIYATGGTCKIANCNFTSNANDIGTIYSLKSTMDISNCSFANNKYLSNKKAYDRDDASELPIGLIYSVDSKLVISNSNFNNNKMCGLSLGTSDCSISNCNFTNTDLAIYSDNSNSTVKNSLFSSLKNGIVIGGGKNTIDACKFIKNTATAIYIDGYSEYESSSYLIRNSSFINNTNKNGASAIYVFATSAKIQDCTFKNNSASNQEGVIFANSDTLVTVIKDNNTQKFRSSVVLDNALKSYPYLVYQIPKSFKTTYKSGKYFTGKVLYGFNKKLWSYFDGIWYAQKGKKEYCGEFGAKIKIDFSKLPVGKYKVEFCVCPDGTEDYPWRYINAYSTITVTKGKTTVYAPYVTAKVKRSKYFKVTVKNTVTKKVIPNLKLKLKVYTGKKYKIYNVKTNKKGIVKFNTKNLKKGKHTVVIMSRNANYRVYKKSRITIKR